MNCGLTVMLDGKHARVAHVDVGDPCTLNDESTTPLSADALIAFPPCGWAELREMPVRFFNVVVQRVEIVAALERPVAIGRGHHPRRPGLQEDLRELLDAAHQAPEVLLAGA